MLEAETRNIRGPRAFEPSGLPFHADNATIVKERLFLDKADRNVLHDEITTNDHALTRPWTVMQTFRREVKEIWVDNTCAENNRHVILGEEHYMISGDGHLMPVRKDQPPPDLKYFQHPQQR